MITDIIDPPRAHGPPLLKAVLKRTPADFRVDEMLAIECSGEGEHLLLQVEKTATNTDEVVSLLQEWYAVDSADVGFCGMKDRHSISSQWFSVRTPLDASVFEGGAVQYTDDQLAQWQGGDDASGDIGGGGDIGGDSGGDSASDISGILPVILAAIAERVEVSVRQTTR